MASSTTRRLSIEYVSPASLKPDPSNPRVHPATQLKKLQRSIQRFGFVVPILVATDDRLVAGHGCLQAAQVLGLEEVPIIRLEGLSEAEATAFRVAHNRLAEDSSWDDQLLGQIFKSLSDLELEFNLEDTGFSMAEIDLKIANLTVDVAAEDAGADLEAPSTATSAVSTLGDLWSLGPRHRLLCGDALEPSSYQLLMGGKAAHMVFTDAPYNVRIRGHVSGKGEVCHREFLQGSGEMTEGQFTHFLATVMHLLARNSVSGSFHYHCMDFRHAFEILNAGRQCYSELKNLCVWVKDNGGMGALYRSRHELIFVFKSGTARHRNNVELGRYGRNRTNVWEYPGASSTGRRTEEGNLLALHPTVKPVALVADAILDCTGRGEIVLDPFLGSGSTLIAAERVGRACHGIELDPLYVDTAIRRWQRHAGESAMHVASGKSFEAVAAEREAAGG